MDEGDLIEKAFDRWTEKIDQKLVARKSFNGFWSFVPGWLIYRCEKRLKHRWIGSWHTLKNLQKWSNKAAVTAEIKMVRLWEGGGGLASGPGPPAHPPAGPARVGGKRGATKGGGGGGNSNRLNSALPCCRASRLRPSGARSLMVMSPGGLSRLRPCDEF